MKKMFITAMAVVIFMGSSAMAARVGKTMAEKSQGQIDRLAKEYGLDVTKRTALSGDQAKQGAEKLITEMDKLGARSSNPNQLSTIILSNTANARVADNIVSMLELADKAETPKEKEDIQKYAQALLVILENSAGIKEQAKAGETKFINELIKGDDRANQARAVIKLLDLSAKGLEMGADATGVIATMVSAAKSKGGDFATNLMKELESRGIKLEDLLKCKV